MLLGASRLAHWPNVSSDKKKGLYLYFYLLEGGGFGVLACRSSGTSSMKTLSACCSVGVANLGALARISVATPFEGDFQ